MPGKIESDFILKKDHDYHHQVSNSFTLLNITTVISLFVLSAVTVLNLFVKEYYPIIHFGKHKCLSYLYFGIPALYLRF